MINTARPPAASISYYATGYLSIYLFIAVRGSAMNMKYNFSAAVRTYGTYRWPFGNAEKKRHWNIRRTIPRLLSKSSAVSACSVSGCNGQIFLFKFNCQYRHLLRYIQPKVKRRQWINVLRQEPCCLHVRRPTAIPCQNCCTTSERKTMLP